MRTRRRGGATNKNTRRKKTPSTVPEDLVADTVVEGNELLYPHLDDPQFNVKLAQRKEFHETRYDGELYPIQARADALCTSAFDILPHQLFVKNFMSMETPYNGLLMFMGLGSGKTCSAIGIAEDMRSYLQLSGLDQRTADHPTVPRIMVIAAPNVLHNFELQLFDPTKLKEDAGVWNIHNCVGNKLIQEINPSHVRGMTRATLIASVKRLISKYYTFMGYSSFVNYVRRVMYGENNEYLGSRDWEIRHLRQHFDDRLIIIDEAHNIRNDEHNKQSYAFLTQIAEHAQNLRIVLLSATPMYNSPAEIVGFANLLNINDGRPPITEDQVFDRHGHFVDQGDDLLRRKLTGYVSYVRGENPYTFPYRIYPSTFDPTHTVAQFRRPTVKFTKKPLEVDEHLQHLDVYAAAFPDNSYQEQVYWNIIEHIRGEYVQDNEFKANFGYTILATPLQALNMVYPSLTVDTNPATFGALANHDPSLIHGFVGGQGLHQLMDSVDLSKKAEHERYNFAYRPGVVERFGRVFHPDHIGKYSVKIANICAQIRKARGICLVYSQFIDGGLIPVALALEEMGFTRYSSPEHPTKNLLASHGQPLGKPLTKKQYVMITGDSCFSKDNGGELQALNAPGNRYGEHIQVVLISMAGAEGLDYKNIRQIHIMDPWYNMNRIEQIIGRGVRNFSHCGLPFAERNVELYLHATWASLPQYAEHECVDMYLYRLSERKAVKIGKVTRLLKEISVDCLLHDTQHGLTAERLATVPENADIQLQLASFPAGQLVPFQVGDRPFTNACDYLASCQVSCVPEQDDQDVVNYTYAPTFMEAQQVRIVDRIRQLFKEKHFYRRTELVHHVQAGKPYPLEHVFSALTYLIRNATEPLVDRHGRLGILVNRGETYLFQPLELDDEGISLYDRRHPLDEKPVRVALAPRASSNRSVPQTTLEDRSADQLLADVLGVLADNAPLPKLKTEWTFYHHVRNIRHFLQDLHGQTDDQIRDHLVTHALDVLPYQDRLTLYRHGDPAVKTYFDRNMVKLYGQPCLVLADGKTLRGYVEGTATPVPITAADVQTLRWAPSSIPTLVGFMHLGIFKVKDLRNKQSKMAVVEQKSKQEIINLINRVLEERGAKIKYEVTRTMERTSAAALLEMILRSYGNTHFATCEQALLL